MNVEKLYISLSFYFSPTVFRIMTIQDAPEGKATESRRGSGTVFSLPTPHVSPHLESGQEIS